MRGHDDRGKKTALFFIGKDGLPTHIPYRAIKSIRVSGKDLPASCRLLINAGESFVLDFKDDNKSMIRILNAILKKL